MFGDQFTGAFWPGLEVSASDCLEEGRFDWTVCTRVVVFSEFLLGLVKVDDAIDQMWMLSWGHVLARRCWVLG